MRTFERILPDGYREVKHIDAAKPTFGILFTVLSMLPFAVLVPVYLSRFTWMDAFEAPPWQLLLAMVCLWGGVIAYIILHELTHGAVYKWLTKEKLTFGLRWSCAFCGVPHIYCYRRTMLLSVTAPFVLFSLIFFPLFIIGMLGNALLALVSGVLLGMHVGGCCGDLYVTFLLLFVYRDKQLLLRDTGPQQTFYMPEEQPQCK